MEVTPPSTLRRLGLALAGLAVAALTGAACALSFDDLRELAILGEARSDLAFLYPAAFDAVLVVALTGVLLLRAARPLVRAQAAAALVLLIVAAAAVNVATALRFSFDVRQAALGAALAPWIMLAVALWLWLLLIKHVQAGRAAVPEEAEPEPDIVPFHRPEPPKTEEQPPLSERVTRWSAPEPEPEPEPEKEPETEEAEPVRWGDRVKPTDVLVHPRTPEVTDRDADTQPVRVFVEAEVETEEAQVADPGHGPEQADDSERDGAQAPSGRLRSTPLPPEE
ncbi:DUF2637 domain-containing protein [Nonomuraea endophytica]|uniref:DUF2637 domain-containing protein n=1 Tax=Nonomuraea endophytica TaxID=714136 RepID=A0A7W7ZXS4_9ACTN|nr:DUF2637 domain-containing protein [Nonomuraea endophytica]MBB5075216.1 hypothetical protein [Nonomuraea endophytica]